jgi:hypothetical protein
MTSSTVIKIDMRRSTLRVLFAGLLAASFLIFGLPGLKDVSRGEAAGPTIALLNPSGFSTAGERGIIVSPQTPSAGPNCCDLADNAYRLSAWTANAPEGSFVFFTVTQSAIEVEIPSSEESSNSWYSKWEIPPEVLDGPATVRAFIVQNDDILATAEQDVTIMKLQDAVDLTYPTAGGTFGTYAALGTSLPTEGEGSKKMPMGTVDALYTDTPTMSYVRSFYTTSAPGTEPAWKVCATEVIGSNNGQAGNGVRCVLDKEADQTTVTGIAAVANDSPDDFQERFNQSGDAVSVSSAYAQLPTNLLLEGEGSQRVERDVETETFFCSTAEVARLTDQLNRQVVGANIDVHATGPSDALKFNTFAVLTSNQAPDRGDHPIETAYDCTGQSADTPPGNANPGEQADHQRFGNPDRKHIETLGGGTSDTGTFSFRLHTNTSGVTEYTMWADELDDGCHVNDDAFTEGELNVSGAIGWGEDVFAVTPQPYEELQPCGPGGEPPPPTGARTISLQATPRKASSGEAVSFTGSIVAVEENCGSEQKVRLKNRRPNGRLKTIAKTITSEDGSYEFMRHVKRTKRYVAVAVANGNCVKARSTARRVVVT